MRLFFIRHGQSENNLLWEETGASTGRNEDPELTLAGHQQARLLADAIAQKENNHLLNGNPNHRDTFHFTHLYTSLMIRAVRTGVYLAQALNMPLLAWPEIHELGGIFLEDKENMANTGLPGKSRSYFLENFPVLHLTDLISEEGWWNRPFENYDDRPLRARAVIATLLERHANTADNVAIVSHGGFYMEFARALFQIRDENAWFLMNNTGISRFDHDNERGWTLVYHNRTDHLPGDLVT